MNVIEQLFLYSTPTLSLDLNSIHVTERIYTNMAPSFDNLTEDNGSDSEEELDVAGSCINSLAVSYLMVLV